MSKYQVERPRHSGEIKRIDEQPRVSDLPAATAPHEPPKLLLIGPSLPRRLLLEGAEGSKFTLSIHDLFHGGGTESADQLVLQIRDTHVETQPFHIDTSEVRAKASPLKTVPEVALLCGVTETRKPDVEPLRSEQIQEPPYGLRTPNWLNGNALSVKIPTTALSERFERAPVADPFNEHDRTRVDARGFDSRRLHQLGSLRPAWRLRLEALDRSPVVSRRREHIDDDRTIRADVHFVRRVRRDSPGSTGAEIASLAADSKGERSLENDAELFVLVAVLRDHAIWIELDHRKTEAITVHGTSENAFPDSERLGCGEIVERAHSFLFGPIASNLTQVIELCWPASGPRMPASGAYALTGTRPRWNR